MISLFIRILLRYIAGYLVLHGFFSQDDASTFMSDPDIAAVLEMGAGVCLGYVVEQWTVFARKMGWKT